MRLPFHRFFHSNTSVGSIQDTIYALATAEGRCGVSIIRISGAAADFCLQQVSKTNSLPEPRMASRRKLIDPITKELLDDAIVLRFPGPKSYTGEDVVEFHLHGSRSVVQGMLTTLGSFQNCRPAEAGEFTERAFSNNRMNLMEIEGLADLLAAETEQQRKQALRQMTGDTATIYETWRKELISCLAHAEAFIDFGDDEDDVTDDAYDNVVKLVKELKTSISFYLADGKRGEIVRNGINIAILGAPNAGKSSLLNILAQRPAAIVSNREGTTRDIIQVPINVAGYPVVLSDTAGIRETTDEIEQEGVFRAQQIGSEADMRIVVIDSNQATSFSVDVRELIDSKTLVVLNKVDLVESSHIDQFKHQLQLLDVQPDQICEISCDKLQGIEEFLQLLKDRLVNDIFGIESEKQGAIITRERHRHHLQACVQHLDAFVENPEPVELATEELRMSIDHIGRILGRIDVEEILDVLFSDFCIGK